jgi:uncharacterized protein (DUF952 family)
MPSAGFSTLIRSGHKMKNIIYKVVNHAQWAAAEVAGEFAGAEIDLEDGYIHFSTSEQVVETVEKHFEGQFDLLLVAVDSDQLNKLEWEPSRGGSLFPHLYENLDLSAVVAVHELPVGKDGKHIFPDDLGN